MRKNEEGKNKMSKKKIEMPSREQFEKMTAKEKKELYEAAKKQQASSAAGFIKKHKKKIIAAAAALAVLIGAGIAYALITGPVIEDSPEEIHNPKDGQVRYMINPAIIVEGKTMTNIEFHSLNKGRSMKVQIKVKDGNDYIYKSPEIKEGKVLISDRLKEKLPKGQTPATAEMFTLDDKGNEINQTNYELTFIQVEE